jgi:SAM-dependent MidA family methyltransferase
VVFDYMRSSAEMATVGQAAWLRTYHGQQRAGDPLVAPGSADITCDVALDQLAFARRPTTVALQRDWLVRHGIDALVEDGRRVWRDRAALGDLVALRARSRIGEAEALTEVDGLGDFTVAEWHS